eukprot:TRINITY_DN10665_c0_g2_i7.p1 TRINITY_DN10665_c0_g2~~TRINITY_DN10665_c0_g2_i7.p1  ORF type:complete len:138 (+),score=6.57 TRINITY_DN10665_c0_g2_i7:110-523(+)
MNGELKGEDQTKPIPFVQREMARIGRSARHRLQDAHSDASFDNVRMWTRNLPTDVIQANFAQGRPERDWKTSTQLCIWMAAWRMLAQPSGLRRRRTPCHSTCGALVGQRERDMHPSMVPLTSFNFASAVSGVLSQFR